MSRPGKCGGAGVWRRTHPWRHLAHKVIWCFDYAGGSAGSADGAAKGEQVGRTLSSGAVEL